MLSRRGYARGEGECLERNGHGLEDEGTICGRGREDDVSDAKLAEGTLARIPSIRVKYAGMRIGSYARSLECVIQELLAHSEKNGNEGHWLGMVRIDQCFESLKQN